MEVAVSQIDPVERLEVFRAKHPKIVIIPPSLANGPYWKALEDGQPVVSDSYWLEWHMDKLEAKYT